MANLDKDWAIATLIDHGECYCTHCQTANQIMNEPDDLDYQAIHNQERKLKAYKNFLAKTHDVREALEDI